MSGTILRPMRADDVPALCALFHAAVREGTAGHYDAAQCAAWSPAPPDPAAWAVRLAGQSVTVAEEGGTVTGFIALRADGHIDLAFVAPERAGRGIGPRLLRAVEDEARTRGLARLTVEASLVARPLFARAGWRTVRRQSVERAGVALTNFAMEKRPASG